MRAIAALVVLVTVCVALLPRLAHAAEPPFAVIAEADSTPHRLTREIVSRIFMRKQSYWESGLRIQPVNLPAAHPLRRLFSQAILGNAPEGFEEYWRDMYFHGVLPPHVLASEEAVVLFVSSTPGAIGYVSACVPAHGVVVVLMVGDMPLCAR